MAPINLHHFGPNDNSSPIESNDPLYIQLFISLLTLAAAVWMLIRLRAPRRLFSWLRFAGGRLSQRADRTSTTQYPSLPTNDEEIEISVDDDQVEQVRKRTPFKTPFMRTIFEGPSLRFRFRIWWANVISKRTVNNRYSKRHRQRARKLAFTDNTEGVDSTNPHKHAADYRSQASKMVQLFSKQTGLSVAAYQSSDRESRHGSASSRTVYVKPSDFEQAPKEFDWSAHIAQFVDVIDYLTDAELALFRSRYIVAYTNQQQQLSVSSAESVCYWCDEETLVEEVKGGAVYRQKPFDFTPDVFMLKGRTGFTLYNVERVHVPDSTRQLIIAIPAADVNIPYWLYASVNYFLGLTAELETPQRMRVTKFNNVLLSSVESNLQMSWIHAPQEMVSIPERLAVACVVGNESTMGGMQRAFREENVPTDQLTYNLLAAYVESKGGVITRQPNFMYSFAGRYGIGKAIQMAPENGLEGAACVKSVEEVATSINLLVEAPRNNHKFTKQEKKWAAEFVREITKGIDAGGLMTEEEIIAELKRPMQINKYLRYFNYPGEASNNVEAMQKIENSNPLKPARIICPVDAKQNVAYATIIAPACKALSKHHKAFVVGCKPIEVTERLQDAAHTAKILIPTDFSTMDATLNGEFRKYLLDPTLTALFPKHRSDVLRITRKMMQLVLKYNRKQYEDCKASGKVIDERGKVEMLGRNCSGASDTTFYNTLVNMFVEFMQHRMNNVAAEDALPRVGPKSGDDGLATTDVRPAAIALGLTIKCETATTLKAPIPVSFCSRIYPDLFRTTTSFHDPTRALARLPTVIPQGKAPRVAHQNRVLGYMKEAPGTVTREYAEALKRVFKYGDVIVVYTADDERYASPPYPFNPMHLQDCHVATAEMFKITNGELNNYIAQLRAATTVVHLEKLPKFLGAGAASHYRL